MFSSAREALRFGTSLALKYITVIESRGVPARCNGEAPVTGAFNQSYFEAIEHLRFRSATPSAAPSQAAALLLRAGMSSSGPVRAASTDWSVRRQGGQ